MGYEHTLLERRQGIVGLLVRLRLVEGNPNRDNGLAYTSELFLGFNGQSGGEVIAPRRPP